MRLIIFTEQTIDWVEDLLQHKHEELLTENRGKQ
jgi:hypothetical protein